MRRRGGRSDLPVMPARLLREPSPDAPLAEWRLWWNARKAWREQNWPGRYIAAWMRDVTRFSEVNRRRWEAERPPQEPTTGGDGW